MSAFCNPFSTNPADIAECVAEGQKAGGAIDAALNPFEAICQAFAEAAADMLKEFAKAFAKFPNIDVTDPGVTDVYSLSMGIGIFAAVILLLLQTARTAITHEGKALAEGLVGVGKAALAMMLTLSLTTAGLLAADELTKWIIKESFGSVEKLTKRLSSFLVIETVANLPQMLLIALLVMLVVVVLWCELLLRNVGIALLVATSPIAAAGMVSGNTQQWWSKTVRATIQLILLKPTVAIIFALGFSLAGKGKSMSSVLTGMLMLLVAALAWPILAKFMTWMSAHSGGAAGMGAVLGFAAGQATIKRSGVAGAASGAEFGASTSDRTMQIAATRMSAARGTAGATKAAAAAGGLAPVVAALQAAQKGANSLAQRMETTAAHAGLDNANPYATPAGHPTGHPTIPAVAGDISSGLRSTTTTPVADRAASAEPPPPPIPPATTDRQHWREGREPASASTNVPSPPPVSAVHDLREPKRFHGPPPPRR
ncbi:conjugal transfer protein TrbL family protein [Stackebrandtia nassauensis]|uniref:TrbL/VirB6 plasmid conjugal transfer protein n=1 Tax=Stackebrandtia nassauensis (strain DSM 44728 / CIP 108903 / NRRL B-16338 / NBRC 102104 / LLR-40K-21) TaxID=446470 RepID=D3PVU4_STANL|nr:conjugal transfer protein TrbL family protein [Stackebrandtia nassauensis]ADD45065.1 hypothetical protein Snas_5433 [Stackebrandtia nassauensis DSM 44728]